MVPESKTTLSMDMFKFKTILPVDMFKFNKMVHLCVEVDGRGS